MQNLPREDRFRECFIPKDGNVMISTDYSSQESRLLASLSGDEAMLDEYGPNGGSDLHSLVAKMIYPHLRNLTTAEIKKNHKEERQIAKGPEFCFAFGGNWQTLVSTYGMDVNEAKEIDANYREGFSGVTKYQNACAKFTETTGYIPICRETGHKSYVYGWDIWKKNQEDPEFWNRYRQIKQSGKAIPFEYKKHFAFQSDMKKNAVNGTTQGLGAVIFKIFCKTFFDWIIENGYFNVVLFCVPAHDEIVIECPKELLSIVQPKLEEVMKTTGELFCHKLEMPVESSVGDHWIH